MLKSKILKRIAGCPRASIQIDGGFSDACMYKHWLGCDEAPYCDYVRAVLTESELLEAKYVSWEKACTGNVEFTGSVEIRPDPGKV